MIYQGKVSVFYLYIDPGLMMNACVFMYSGCGFAVYTQARIVSNEYPEQYQANVQTLGGGLLTTTCMYQTAVYIEVTLGQQNLSPGA